MSVCGACGYENPAGHKFCGECGTRLESRCGACGTVNPPSGKFCSECGAQLAGADARPNSTPPAPTNSFGARDTQGALRFADGRYEGKKFLGEGGKKLVYLAHDTLLDRDVAFALIKTEGLDDVGRERVRREAQAMGRLGAHSHVVSVFDFGEHQGQPYIVTELMGGGDVEGLIGDCPDHRVPIAQALRIMSEVCHGLEYAHAHKIVHRDLKPGNVWLTSDGTAKIGDFGLAVALDRSRLTQTGLMVGTVSYMPPEQALGGEVTPRSDLYALGAMLYEMMAGRPPFIGDESVAIITQHLNTPPVAPSWHDPSIPPGLETLILRLLEKDPSRRPGSASEVRQALLSVADSGIGGRPHLTSPTAVGEELPPLPLGEGWGEGGPAGATAGVSEGASADASAARISTHGENPLYRTTFVGRDAELEQAKKAFERARSGQGGVLMVAGEPGIGKTALCEQLSTFAAVRGGRTLLGHSYEEGHVSLPYLPFIEAIRDYAASLAAEDLQRLLGSAAWDLARIVPEIADRGGVPASSPDGRTGDPEEERWRLLEAVVGFLRRASQDRPLLIVLEDLHWSDRGTLDVMLHLARRLQDARILVVGTYRDLDVDLSHPLSSALAELRRGPGFERIMLRGLSDHEVQRMLSAIANQDVTWAFAQAVFRQTEGNPLFVQEVVRWLADEGLVARRDGRWQPTGNTPLEQHIPEGLREVIGRRLARLSPMCTRVLTLASVIGRDFSLETVGTIADVSEDELIDALEEAARVGVLQEQARVGGASYRFAHAFFRQTLYEDVSIPRRLRLHQQVARALEEQYEEHVEDYAGILADHFAHSSDPADLAKAVQYGEIASQRAISLNAYGEAIRFLEQALEVQGVLDPEDRSRRCDLLLALGQALLPAGEPGRAYRDVAPEALVLAEALGNRGRAVRACRVAYEGMSRSASGPVGADAAALRQWAEALDRYADEGTRMRVYADVAMAGVCVQDGDWAKARHLAEHAYELATEVGDPEATLWSAAALLSPYWAPPYQERTFQLADDVIARSWEGVANRTLELTLRRCGMVFLAAGRREAAERCWAQIDQVASRTQDAVLLLWPDTREAIVATLDGDFARALDAAKRLEARAEELDSAADLARFLRPRPLLALGGSFDTAETVDGGLRGWRGLGGAVGLRILGMAAQGQVEEAASLLKQALEDARVAERDDVPSVRLAGLLEGAVALGDAKTASMLAEKLRGTIAVDGDYGLSNVARLRGAASAMVRDTFQARTACAQALDWATSIGYRPEVALTRFQLAELLLDETISPTLSQTEREQQRAEGHGHLEFAIEEFRAMKMQPSLERALRHKGLLHA